MNNPIVKLAIVLVILVGGGYFGLTNYRAKKTEYENKLGLERIRREWLERQPLARLMPDAEKYRFEQLQLFKWYFNELTEHYNKFQGLKNYERFSDDLELRKRQKKIKDNEYAPYAERYKLTFDLWEAMRTGKYETIFTAQDRGLRFDVYRQETAGDKLRLYYALYGTQRKWTADTTSGPKILKLTVNANFHSLSFSGLDADGKEIRKFDATGEPYKIDNPERFIEEFPPGIVFGYYDLPKIPSEVITAELTFDIATRSVLSGEEVPAKFVWKQPLPADWKGGNWGDAQEQVREEAPPPEPAKGKKK